MAVPASQLLAPKVRDLFFSPTRKYIPSRYKCMHGGRGGLKSWGFGRTALALGTQRKLRIMCAREWQNSIQDSVHKLLSDQIDEMELSRYYDVQNNIVRGIYGTEFIFTGIRNNPKKIKSTEGIDIVWIEEAENISKESWEILIPTIRKAGSEIWVSFNPDQQTDPTSQRFIVNPPANARIIKTSWRDNPWLSNELREEKDYLARVDPDAYQHVWEGEFRKNSAAQIFSGKYTIGAFDPQSDWSGPYYGADWGFSQDPSTCVKLWIHKNTLYVEHEAWGIGVDIDATPALFDKVPGARNGVVRADCARPETISYMRRHGYSGTTGVEKWAGSVEDGITVLRSFEKIVIHPRCEHTAQEARLYSFKVDKLTGDVLTDIVDKHNHCFDAIRYALQPIIRQAGTGLLEFMRQQAEAKLNS